MPWKLLKMYFIFRNIYSFIYTRIKLRNRDAKISYILGYQEVTGQTIAISEQINALNSKYNVSVYINLSSEFSKILSINVKRNIVRPDFKATILIVDLSISAPTLEKLDRKITILTCHCFPLLGHDYTQKEIVNVLNSVNYIHFVSQVQYQSFVDQYPGIPIANKSFVIANFSKRVEIRRSQTVNTLGCVGHLNRKLKNGLSSVALAEKSQASQLLCWGSSTIYGIGPDKINTYKKTKIMGWSSSHADIFQSFNVLISTSHVETFGLVVIEALSLGKACILSNIPAYQELFGGCECVYFLTGDELKDIEGINRMLNLPNYNQKAVDYWQKHFSSERLYGQWEQQLNTMLKL